MKKIILILFSLNFFLANGQNTTVQSTGGLSLGASTSLVAGTNITLTKSANTTTITAGGGSGTVTAVNAGTNLSITAGTSTVNPTLDIIASPSIKGSGTTNATYSLKVDNSTGSNKALRVFDDGMLAIGTDSTIESLSDVAGVSTGTETLAAQWRTNTNNRSIFAIGNYNKGSSAATNIQIGHGNLGNFMQIITIPLSYTTGDFSGTLKGQTLFASGSGMGINFYSDANMGIGFGCNNADALTGMKALYIRPNDGSHTNFVGIGTRSPLTQFEVNTTSVSGFIPSGAIANFASATGVLGSFCFGGNTAGDRGIKLVHTAAGYAYIQGFSRTDGSTRDLSIQPDGSKLGIGTLSPATTLDVNGTITATGLVITSPIPLVSGGTNSSLAASNGSVIYSTASQYSFTAVGTTGQVLTSNGAAAPTWNSPSYGSLSMVANASATTLASSGTYSLVVGTTTGDQNNNFTASSAGRLTYTGTNTQVFEVVITATLKCASAVNSRIAIFKNGTLIPRAYNSDVASTSNSPRPIPVTILTSLSTNDYVEMYVYNETSGTNITVEDEQMVIH